MYKTLLLLFLAIMMVGCASIYGDKGIIRNRNTEYLKAKSIPPLKIPPGMSSSTIETSYPVPERDYPSKTREISLTPPGLDTSK